MSYFDPLEVGKVDVMVLSFTGLQVDNREDTTHKDTESQVDHTDESEVSENE